jgi:hypothetical protein
LVQQGEAETALAYLNAANLRGPEDFDLFDDLFVGLAEPEPREMAGLSGPRCPARVKKDLDRAEVCGRQAVNELGDDRSALGDLPLPTIVGAASLPAGASHVRRNGG